MSTRWSDHDVEQLIGRLLQAGVMLSASITIIGGVMFLIQHGTAVADYHSFSATPGPLSTLGGIVHGALSLDSAAIVQLGLVLLIATPVMRVALTLVAFAIQRDRLYVLITAVVLALLLYGLIRGRA